jgi:hypothetical protein
VRGADDGCQFRTRALAELQGDRTGLIALPVQPDERQPARQLEVPGRAIVRDEFYMRKEPLSVTAVRWRDAANEKVITIGEDDLGRFFYVSR